MWVSCVDSLNRKCHINLDKVTSVCYDDNETLVCFEGQTVIPVKGDIIQQLKNITDCKVLRQGE